MATKTHLNDEIMKAVGRVGDQRHGLITANLIAKFSAAIDDRNPLYLDRDAARAAGYDDVIAPPLFNATVTRPVPARSGLLNDGQFDNAAPPGLTHLQTMLAGQRWEIVRRSTAGERTIEQFTTKSIVERQGATGPVVFVESEVTITSADKGDVIERYTNTTILREPPPPLPAFAGGDAEVAPPPPLSTRHEVTSFLPDGTMIKRPDMISLFMFSATIWAVHRIHWDVPYARSEGLPGPVLPGWMLSSYLAELAERKAPEGQRLHKIDVRYRAPVHPDDILECRATRGDELALAMTNQKGMQVATAIANFIAG